MWSILTLRMPVQPAREIPFMIVSSKHLVRLVLMVCLTGILFGCAYFNTYYNGQTAFDSAYQEHQTLIRKSPDTLTTIPATIVTGYDTAISKSIKVIQNFPKDKKWHDKAVFLIGKSLFYKGEYTRATRRFRQLIDEFPKSRLVPAAYLFYARSLVKDDNLTSAEAACAHILAKYPEINKNQDVSLLLADIARKRGSSAMALSVLTKALDLAREDERRMFLSLQIGKMHLSMSSYGLAKDAVAKAPRNLNFSALVFELDTVYLVASIANKEYRDALQKSKKMLREKSMLSHTGEILYFRGAALRKLDRIDSAIIVFEHDIKVYPAHPRCGQVWFALGEIYQERHNFSKAGECYSKAASLLRDKTLAALALERSKAIADIGYSITGADTLKKAVKPIAPKDTTGMRMYRIGELFWLSLSEPDSAYTYFMRMATDTLIKGDSAAKALYAAGYIAFVVRKDSVLADSIFGSLAKRYPASEYVKQSQKLRELPVTVMTAEDSAFAAFLVAETALFSKDSARIDSAAAGYYDVYRRFTHTSFGAKALFCAAWTNDFILEKNKSALRQYEELCDTFPSSEYCIGEARGRILTVADTLRVRKAQKKIDDARKVREAPVPSVPRGVHSPSPLSKQLLPAGTVGDPQKVDSVKSDTGSALPLITLPDTSAPRTHKNDSLGVKLPDTAVQSLPEQKKPQASEDTLKPPSQ